jgi:sugar lactone lactonase YvrE
MSARGIILVVVILAAILVAAGTMLRSLIVPKPDLVWGSKGVLAGKFVRPRAATVDRKGRIFIVDFTARIQSYDSEGQHTGLTWETPDFRNGRPSGLSTNNDGNIMVSDSHYHCLRIYSAEDGKLLKTLGGERGTNPGQFGYVSDCVQGPDGCYYLSEFGQNDRITKLDSEGKFLTTWGKSGIEPGEFARLRSLAFGPDGLLYAADACNHRVQVFTTDGKLVRVIGKQGAQAGQFSYPYDLCFNKAGELYVVERGNMRIQKLTKEGKCLGMIGGPGAGEGQFADPWAIVIDHNDRLHVIDTENHRVQRVNW